MYSSVSSKKLRFLSSRSYIRHKRLYRCQWTMNHTRYPVDYNLDGKLCMQNVEFPYTKDGSNPLCQCTATFPNSNYESPHDFIWEVDKRGEWRSVRYSDSCSHNIVLTASLLLNQNARKRILKDITNCWRWELYSEIIKYLFKL